MTRHAADACILSMASQGPGHPGPSLCAAEATLAPRRVAELKGPQFLDDPSTMAADHVLLAERDDRRSPLIYGVPGVQLLNGPHRTPEHDAEFKGPQFLDDSSTIAADLVLFAEWSDRRSRRIYRVMLVLNC
jgi:hypothetical protein